MIDIPKSVMTILNMLNSSGFKAYVVGGCVRDSVMGRQPHDWDVATSAYPDEVKAVFSDFKTVDTGILHGTVLVISGEMPVEVTTFRIDGDYTDNRHPDSVLFTDDIRDDLSRRDFTVNAMAYSLEEGLIDIFGGRKDIENKIIRCVGDPDVRFSEDALRILRALRFSSVLNFSIEEKTAQSILSNERLLTSIAYERIDSELLKLLCGGSVLDVLINYKSVFGVIMPELVPEFDHKQYGKKHAYDIWTHTAHTVEAIESDPVLRLTMLLHDSGKPATHKLDENGNSTFKNHGAVGGVIAENILKRMKFSKEYIKTVSNLVAIHDKKVPETRVQVKEYMRDYGENTFIRLMKIRKADRAGLAEGFRDINDKLIFAYSTFNEIINGDEPYTLKQLAVNGRDLKKIVPREDIGAVLSFLLNTVIEDPQKNDRQTLLNIAEQIAD
ncbi:MAG: HD domain-containing protein [Clostridiales bacterium]|nr:HD domain-containing protein [Clostridiales bacterium]